MGGATTAQQGPLGGLMDAYRNMDPAVRTKAHRDEVMQLWVRGETLRLTNARAAQNARSGNPGPESSVSKLMLAEFNKDLTAKGARPRGTGGDGGLRLPVPPAHRDLTRRKVRRHPPRFPEGPGPTQSRGGTSEIMRNILGEQVLGLPGEPRVDKEIPWREVPRN